MESAIDNLRVAGGAAGSYRFAAGADDKIESMLVTFPKSGYATAKAGVVGKYGKPTSQRVRTMQNRMGGTFSGEELSWDLPQGAIRLSELADKVDESLLVMESRAIADKAAAEAKNRVRDAPSKL